MAKAKPGFLTLRGGKWRGKKIPIPADGSVRPTTDRAREQAFALLDQHFRHVDGRMRWAGARILDAFAGTGALGLEAASRGAKHVQLWDVAAAQARSLAEAAKGFPGVVVTKVSALSPPPAGQPMDLIFLDPPYHKGLVDQALGSLGSQGWINASTLIYAETEASTPPPKGFDILVERTSASSCLRLLKQADQNVS